MNQSKENKVVIDGLTRYGGLNQPRHFVKVNVDCWEKIFDYLSLRDIIAMSQTCQRMQKIGGHYFRENFHGTACKLDINSDPYFSFFNNRIELGQDDFLRFVDTFSINATLEILNNYMNDDLLRSLTKLHLSFVRVNEIDIPDFQHHRLDNIETVELFGCSIHQNTLVQFLNSCPKLKCLQFYSMVFDSSSSENSFFQQTFPMLEYFQYIHCTGMVPLTSFLERNPTIKCLRIANNDLRGISFDTSTIHLDCLNIQVYSEENDVFEFVNRLKALYTNGSYKKLHILTNLGLNNFNFRMFDELTSFSALEVLCTCRLYTNICNLIELKELLLWKLKGEANLETIAMNLTKLERLWIGVGGTIDHLLPFLRYSKTLKMVILKDHVISDTPLDLFHLNQVRRMGEMQRKVRIGVFENQYLATKWKAKNMNYDLVEVVRAETILERFEYKDLLVL